jgi:hypothetical protein
VLALVSARFFGRTWVGGRIGAEQNLQRWGLFRYTVYARLVWGRVSKEIFEKSYGSIIVTLMGFYLNSTKPDRAGQRVRHHPHKGTRFNSWARHQ